MTGDEEAIEDTTYHMCITQEPLRKEMQFEHMVFLECFLKHSNLLPFWHFSGGNFNTTTETSAEFENFSYILRTETVVKRQKMPRNMCHS